MKYLKDYFIPHKGNDYHPRLFKGFGIGVVFVFVIVLFISSAGCNFIAQSSLLGNVYSTTLVDLTNKTRVAENLISLTINPSLEDAAQLKAEDMLTNGYFAHTSPAGITPWHWFTVSNYEFLYAGENLAVGYTTSESVNNAWMNSPVHKANIESINFTDIGIATKEGIYKGKETTFVVQLFGQPEKVAQASTLTKVSVIQTKTQIASYVPEMITVPIVETISEDKSTIIGKNIGDAEFVGESVLSAEAQAGKEFIYQTPWYKRLIVNQPLLVRDTYFGIVSLLILGLILFIFIEIRIQHWRHVVYGVLLICFVIILMILNNRFIFMH